MSFYILAQPVSGINAGDIDKDIDQPAAALEEQLKKLREQGEQAAQGDGDTVVFDGLIH